MRKFKPIVQGHGHAEFENGFRCALYIDDDGDIYATADLVPIDTMKRNNGNYIQI